MTDYSEGSEYTQARLAECQTETERQNVLAFIRQEEKESESHDTHRTRP